MKLGILLSSSDAALAFAGASILMGLLFSLVFYILLVVAQWKIFTKAGEAGWKSIIPFYNSYTMFKLCWDTKFFWIMLAAALANGILSNIHFAPASILSLVCSIVILVIFVMQNNNLSKAFGKGVGFTVGLVLLSVIFTLILGLGSSQYIGNTTKNVPEDNY